MKKILLSLLLAGGVQNSFAMQGACADVNAHDDQNRTDLMIAAGKGQVDVVKELLKKGADVNSQNVGDWTALTIAAYAGHVDVVQELLANGADVNIEGFGNKTALMFAAQNGHVEVVRNLIASMQSGVESHSDDDLKKIQAAINLKDSSGGTALIYAAKNGHLEILKMLLRYRPDLDAEMYGKKAYQWAAEWDKAKGDEDHTLTKAIMLARVERGL